MFYLFFGLKYFLIKYKDILCLNSMSAMFIVLNDLDVRGLSEYLEFEEHMWKYSLRNNIISLGKKGHLKWNFQLIPAY